MGAADRSPAGDRGGRSPGRGSNRAGVQHDMIAPQRPMPRPNEGRFICHSRRTNDEDHADRDQADSGGSAAIRLVGLVSERNAFLDLER